MDDFNLPGTLHDLEKTAARHLWFHGPEESWEELTEQEGMRVFARGEGSTLWDVRGRAYLDGLSGLFVVNAGHGRREIGEAMAEQAEESPIPPHRPAATMLRSALPRNSPASRQATSHVLSLSRAAPRPWNRRSRSPGRHRRCAGSRVVTRSSHGVAPITA